MNCAGVYIISQRKNILLISNIYVSSVVGAGFATGQEIFSFFTKHGLPGFLGILISTLLLSLSGGLVLNKAINYDVRTISEMAEIKFGKPGAIFIKIVSAFLQFSVFAVMLSGLKTIICKFNIPDIAGALIIAGAIFLIISSDIKRVLKFNSIITPIVIIGITGTCILLLLNVKGEPVNVVEITNGINYKWVISALLYGYFNSLLSVQALCSAKGSVQVTQKASLHKHFSKNVIYGGILGGILIGAMAFISNIVLYKNAGAAGQSEMPIVYLASKHMNQYGNIYQLVIFTAMAGSAVICGKSTIELFQTPTGKKHKKRNDMLKAFCVCIFAVPLSLVNFSGLINVLYPFFGAVGVVAMIFILC